MTELHAPRWHRFRCSCGRLRRGLELILAQEGVPFETVKDPHPLSFRGGPVRAFR